MKQQKCLKNFQLDFLASVSFGADWQLLGTVVCPPDLFALQTCLLGGTEAQCYYDMEIFEEFFKIYQISFSGVAPTYFKVGQILI